LGQFGEVDHEVRRQAGDAGVEVTGVELLEAARMKSMFASGEVVWGFIGSPVCAVGPGRGASREWLSRAAEPGLEVTLPD
jgi:hypothetical protein